MTWHIIGGNSYIAQRLIPRLIDCSYICYGRSELSGQIHLDLTAIDAAVYDNISEGDFVVFFAAISSPDLCQNHYEDAYALNVTGTEAFIRSCLRKNTRVLFFSSDAVLGASSVPMDEDACPAPIGNYAAMKRTVELDLQGERNLKIFRLSYVFSWKDKFTSYLRECEKNGATADVFDALYRNVVYIEDLVDAVIALASSFDSWDNQIFHICGTELLSRKDMARLYCSRPGNRLQYMTSIPGDGFFQARPNVIEMKSKYFSRLLGRAPTRIADAMQREAERNADNE